MTFARSVKNELVTVPTIHEEMLAEFSAFLNLVCEFEIVDNKRIISFQTKNPTVTKRFLLLSKTLYDTETELLQKEAEQFSKKPLIILRLTKNVSKIINEHDFLGDAISNVRLITYSDITKIAFLRGAFLVAGSVNHPKTSNYHLEIFANNEDEIILIQSLMNHFDLNARITKRRKGFIAYLKDADSISDFIKLIGAHNAVFKFEDVRIKRDFNNSINRVINMEIANEQKSYLAGREQLENIKILRKHLSFDQIDDKIVKVIELREKYPEANLRELSELYNLENNEKISRSGINHRLNKIKELASNYRKEN